MTITFRDWLLWAALGGVLLACAQARAATAPEIIARTDQVRNPQQPFHSTVTLVEYVSGRERDQDTLTVFAKMDPGTHQFRNLVQYAAPRRDAGKRVLLGGGALWFYDPASKASVRISPAQQLVGQAAIGDVLTVNLAADYSAILLGTQAIEDATRTQRKCWHLQLKAADDLATYSRVEYWVEQGTYLPIKGEFYSDSGRLLKVAYYRNFSDVLGSTRPTQTVIIDAVDKSLATVATSTDYGYQDIPDTWFQRDYLPHLETR
ncbi:MAG TPA: outer membrane lipoprotein-sorting protein [Steroidobacteraceae bacterium]|nr:outer membrane lipoprotein-sorting protein [Steroidobacteraceae bacterium]